MRESRLCPAEISHSCVQFPAFFPRTDFLSGREQGIAPTVITITLGRLIRTTVGAIPCGCPEPRLKI